MHAVDRGDEPAGLERIRRQLTPRWVDHYRRGRVKPTDARWRDFQRQLAARFRDICGYCEELCKGEVDHFQPKSRFPVLVYEWTNWILACHTCNGAKLEKWPSCGYVDPCARRGTEYPEAYFDFHTPTAEIVPGASLAGSSGERPSRPLRIWGLTASITSRRGRSGWLPSRRQSGERQKSMPRGSC